MGEVLKNTSWPSIAISAEAQSLISHFFALVDDKAESAGTELAKEVFTENGSMIAATGTFTGSTAITKSREHAWDVISSRKHELLRVYACEPRGLDVLAIGKLVATRADGREAEAEFVARIVMERTLDRLRISLYQVWSAHNKKDQTPLKQLVSS